MNTVELFDEMKNVFSKMEELNVKWVERKNKTAARDIRKLTSILDKMNKEYRKLSVQECKEIKKNSE